MPDTEPRTDKRMIVAGATLMGVAAVLGFAGLTLEAMAVVAATRRRIARMEEPPSELAKRQWRLSRAAARAGVDAWRNQLASQGSTPAAASGVPNTPSVAHDLRV